ncbi:MAG: HAMP domain-containing histidine kinase, partial [Armatimonadetes bacterium]|nr:HAMP domain-containing histidine kinase [Armatimonadota bacterium]
REVVAIASSGGADLVEMINDLLDVAKLEAGQPLIQVGPCAAAEFIADGANALRPLAQRNEVELAIDLPPDLPGVQGDCERLRRVVMNLVGNALKFTPSGGRVEVSGRTDKTSNRMLVSVSDNGDGIPKELQDRIFDKFAVAEARRSSGGRSSTGLGLTFCKLIVEAHGGEIWVESEPGHGSTFTFSLPLGGELR